MVKILDKERVLTKVQIFSNHALVWDQALGKPLRGEMLVVLSDKDGWEVQRTGMAIPVRCTSPLDIDHFATNILGRCPIAKPCVL